MSGVPAPLQFEAAAATHAGCLRRVNQDAWSYAVDAGVAVVCDGMGGAAGGEIASQTAAEAFLEHMAALPPAQRTQKTLAQAVLAANRRVHNRATQERSLAGMGTTLVALAAGGSGQVLIAHVGDSRCYLWRGATLTRCTTDHSLVEEQVRMGVLTPEQAAHWPMRNVITRAVGTARTVVPGTQAQQAAPGDVFLLCSDGLTRELSDAEIAETLRGAGSLQEKNEALVQAALQAGGRDNITSLLVALLQ